MSSGEEVYLALVLASFSLFGLTLFCVSVIERSWAKANNRG